MIKSKMEKTVVLYNLFLHWLLETAAFILLPLIVYLIVFAALNIEQTKLIELPEWMFVSIILHGEIMRKYILFYSNYKGFHLKAIRQISLGILGIVTSSVFLVFSMVAHYREAFTLPPFYYRLQMLLFFFSIANSLFASIWIGLTKGEGHLLSFMYKNESEEEHLKDG
jgi:hypothetical protein